MQYAQSAHEPSAITAGHDRSHCAGLLGCLDRLASQPPVATMAAARELFELLSPLALALAERVADLEELSAPDSSDCHPRHGHDVKHVSRKLSRLRRSVSELLVFQAWETLSSEELGHLAGHLAQQLRAALDGETELYLAMHWDDLGLAE